MDTSQTAMELQRVNAEIELREIDEELKRREAKSHKKEKSFYKDLPRYGAQAVRMGAASLGNLVDFPFLPFEVARYGVESLRGNKPTFGDWIPGTGQKIKKKFDEVTSDYAKPQNKSEELAEDVGESLAGLVSGTGMAGALSKIPGFMKIGSKLKPIFAPTAANIGASAGAPLAARHYQESVQDAGPLGTLLAGTTGALLGGYGAAKSPHLLKTLTTSPKDTAAKLVGKVTKFSPERYEEWKKLGIPSTIGSASEHNWPLGVELTMNNLPWTEKYVAPILAERMKKVAKAAGIREEDLRTAVENPRHHLAKEGALKHKEAKGAEYKALEAGWDEFERELIKKQTTANVQDILSKLEDEYKLGAIKPTDLKHFKKTFPGRVYEDIQNSIKDHAATPSFETIVTDLKKQGFSAEAAEKYALKAAEELTPPDSQQASLQVLKNLKEEALNRSQSPTLSVNEKRKAANIHSMLRDKIVEVMETHGTPEQVAGAKQAKQLWAEYASPKQSDMQRNVEELLTKRTDAGAFGSLWNKEKKHLEAASKYLSPDERRDLAESMIAVVGRKDGHWDPVKAFSAFDKWSPKVQDDFLDLFKTPKQRENFLNVKKLIEDNKMRFQSIANTSKTSTASAVINTAQSLANSLGKLSLGVVGASAHAVAGAEGLSLAAIGYLLSKGGAKVWTDPVFLERVNRVMKADKASSLHNHLSLLLKTPSIKQLSRKGTGAILDYDPKPEREEEK